jgi:hypothetical protein
MRLYTASLPEEAAFTEIDYSPDDITPPRQPVYGFRVHVRLEWPGVITRFSLANAPGWVLGDRNDWSPRRRRDVAPRGIALLAPYRSAQLDRWPR